MLFSKQTSSILYRKKAQGRSVGRALLAGKLALLTFSEMSSDANIYNMDLIYFLSNYFKENHQKIEVIKRKNTDLCYVTGVKCKS